jgi:2-desacetyl-2-hydroxyethyl bacteriochlorophyllide A dehydrogenase
MNVMCSTMKALVYEGPRSMNMREVAVPFLQSGEVLIRVGVAGICGSELSGYLGHNTLRTPPLVMGHEFAGTITAVGEGCNQLHVGDRVTANPLVTCGRCRDCLSGAANLCASRRLVGAGRPGAFAAYVAVPEINVYRLKDHVSFEEGAFVEPFACAVRVCRLAAVKPEHRMLIVGAGPIGLFVLQTAKVYGLHDVVVMDINRDRLEIVQELGGVPVGSLEELQALAPSRGFDVAVDAVGMDVTRQQCVEYARPGGRVVLSGLHAAESTLPINLAIRNELAMFGSFGYTPADFETALEWLTDNKVDLMPWTISAPLEQGQSCFEKLLSGPGKVAKILMNIS